MKSREDSLLLVLIGLVVLVFALNMLPHFLGGSTRLRGNQFALILCRQALAQWKASDTNAEEFNLGGIPTEERQKLAARLSYFADAWIKTNFPWATDRSNREVVIVCGKAFDNVPKPAIWNLYHRNPAHVVGYSDGSTGLLSPQEFTNLNLSGFLSLSKLAGSQLTPAK